MEELGEKAYYSTLNNDYPDQLELHKTNHNINIFKIRNGRELTRLYNKADVILLADISEIFIETIMKEFKIIRLYDISLRGYTWNVGLRYTNINLERVRDVNMFQMFESVIRGGISGVFGGRYLK